MGIIEWLLVVALVLFLLYKWSQAKHEVLHHRGIPHEKPWPIFGNIDFAVLFGKESIVHSNIKHHLQFPNSKVYGGYLMHEPLIFLRDLELVKKVGIKDFDIFPNHRPGFPESDHEILLKTLVNLKDRPWKEMRQILSPSFTGIKMRLMFELVNECCIEGVKYLDKELKATGKNELDLEMLEYFTRFTNDVIASTAFGIKVNSFEDKTNDFYTIGRQVTNFSGFIILRSLFITFFPWIARAFRLTILGQSRTDYFWHLVFGAMKIREREHIVRPDMIQLLMEARKHYDETKATNSSSGEHADLSDDYLLAQCLIFFFAGFDTVSRCLCFTAHELLENQEVQERLYEEIVETERELEGKPINYDTLMKMKYMDMVLSESLRKWPPAIATDRVCTADYTLTDEEGNFVAEIKKGEQVVIPILGIQHDPQYFPDPEKFDPERFSDENKAQLNPTSYLPFGLGPRSCIGNRLGLMETKAIFYHMLLKFKIVRAEKTTKDMAESIRGLQVQPKEGFWMKFVPREK